MQTSLISGVLVRLILHAWPVTVAVAVADTLPPSDVPEAVAMLVVVALIARVLVSVALAPGASGPHAPTAMSSAVLAGVPLSSDRVPDASKVSPSFLTT